MKKYLVGGAVRDNLLGLPIYERDWVVIGSTPEEMIQQGFVQVGKDFPVFLHPITKEEYALARTERKSGNGYGGFVCDFNNTITLEQDLLRRDLTINAIAMDHDNKLIDPYHGINDIHQRILRHVSPAFREDPLRVLRVARFAARFYDLDFAIAPETLQLMQQITASGEIQHLTAERVWKETEKALHSQNPQVYFKVLKSCGALAVLFPELDAIFGQFDEQNRDLGLLALSALKHATALTPDINIRFASLCLNINNSQNIKQLCTRAKIPNHATILAVMAQQYSQTINHIELLTAEQIIQFFDQIDIWRKPERLKQLIICCVANQPESVSLEDYPQNHYLQKIYQKVSTISAQEVIAAGFQGKAIREQLTQLRINAIN